MTTSPQEASSTTQSFNHSRVAWQLESYWHARVRTPIAVFVGNRPGRKPTSRYFYCTTRHSTKQDCSSFARTRLSNALFAVAGASGCDIKKNDKCWNLHSFSNCYALIDLYGSDYGQHQPSPQEAADMAWDKIVRILRTNRKSRQLMIFSVINKGASPQAAKAWRLLSQKEDAGMRQTRFVHRVDGDLWSSYALVREKWVSSVACKILKSMKKR
jgi:hypothetical protein